MDKADKCQPLGRKHKKRVSKKNKIAWRKHCDTRDVDKFMDDQRHEERVGIKFANAKDEQIFFIDKKKKRKVVEKKIDKKREAQKRLDSGPAYFQSLLAYSSVPDPIVKRNKVRSKEEKKRPIKKKIEALRVQGKLTAKEQIAHVNRENNQKRKSAKPKLGEFTDNLWGEDPKKLTKSEWLDLNTLRHVQKNTGNIQKAVPETVQRKPSVLQPIVAPHPGTSYNPSYVDHRKLIHDVAEKEKLLIKEEEHLNRVTSRMFSKVTAEEHENAWIKEMSQGHAALDSSTNHGKDDEYKCEKEVASRPTIDKKKDRKTRRNVRQARKEQSERNLKSIEKKKLADVYKLRSIMKNITQEELELQTKLAKRLEKRRMKKLGVLRLSKVKFQEPEADFPMPYDLSGNLVELKAEGNILVDRFKAMQRRNIIQPTVLQRPKVAKKKVFTKSSHK